MKKTIFISIFTLPIIILLSLNFKNKNIISDIFSNKTDKISLITQIKIPKNIILMIIDGGGFNHLLATNYFQNGIDYSQQYESFPVKYALATYPAKTGSYPNSLQINAGYNPRNMWSNFNYAMNDFTESASASTAFATGVKTYNNSIGMDINYQPLVNIVQIAKSKNKSAGVVTSVQFSHATPAAFVAHNLSRQNYSEIAFEMLLDSKCDVIMGAGNPDFDDNGEPSHETYKYVGDSLTWLGLHAGNTMFYVNGVPDTVEDVNGDGIRDPWHLIQDRNQFQNLITGETPLRVLGVPKIHSTLQQKRSGDSYADPFAVPLLTSVPTLAEMTKGALNVLDNNQNGFLLIIEGGAVDWASHSNQKGRMIEEHIDFNNAVNTVIEWVNLNSNWNETMVIITADHECGFLWGPNSGVPSIFNPIINNGQGNLPGMTYYSEDHTNSLVPFFAKGTGSQLFSIFADEFDPVRGIYIQNSEIGTVIKILWGSDNISKEYP